MTDAAYWHYHFDSRVGPDTSSFRERGPVRFMLEQIQMMPWQISACHFRQTCICDFGKKCISTATSVAIAGFLDEITQKKEDASSTHWPFLHRQAHAG